MTAFKVPFQIDPTGKVATVDGRRAETRQQVSALVNTRVRERVMRPSYGTRALDFLFDPLDDLLLKGMKEDIRTSIERFMPEIVLTTIEAGVVRDTVLEVEFTYSFRDLAAPSTVDTVEIDVGGTVRESRDVGPATARN